MADGEGRASRGGGPYPAPFSVAEEDGWPLVLDADGGPVADIVTRGPAPLFVPYGRGCNAPRDDAAAERARRLAHAFAALEPLVEAAEGARALLERWCGGAGARPPELDALARALDLVAPPPAPDTDQEPPCPPPRIRGSVPRDRSGNDRYP